MKSVSIIAAAAVMLASSVSAASNDPRECEGTFDSIVNACILGCSVMLIAAHPYPNRWPIDKQ